MIGTQFIAEEQGKMKVEMMWTCDRYEEEDTCIQRSGEGTRRKETIPKT
jgi:hypothetical protein